VGESDEVGGQSLVAVQQVLDGVVGRVADVGLGIDDQPRLALRGDLGTPARPAEVSAIAAVRAGACD